MDYSSIQHANEGKLSWLRSLLGLAVCVALGAWLWSDMEDAAGLPVDLAEPLPLEGPHCRVAEGSAFARGQALENLADASWERLPFDSSEAPQAALRMAESESCYRVAGDRESIQRTSVKRRIFDTDLRRRWARAKLTLEFARRRGDAAALRREIAILLALSSQAGATALPYHERLRKLDRAAEGLLLEAKAKED